ncbi:hypothetical protein T07_10313 [Trichinella nelsoni]|uniref:Uncharacterized protein n=1 Tax=Trichinella nelsoni TaxID=6336 RepID=A0A0V0RD13_9BILA|nr:hypothetical protein T07_10313 [Trichinella nelsoni]
MFKAGDRVWLKVPQISKLSQNPYPVAHAVYSSAEDKKRTVVFCCCNQITSRRSIRRAGYGSCCLTTAIGKWFRISWPKKDCDLVIFDAGV